MLEGLLFALPFVFLFVGHLRKDYPEQYKRLLLQQFVRIGAADAANSRS